MRGGRSHPDLCALPETSRGQENAQDDQIGAQVWKARAELARISRVPMCVRQKKQPRAIGRELPGETAYCIATISPVNGSHATRSGGIALADLRRLLKKGRGTLRPCLLMRIPFFVLGAGLHFQQARGLLKAGLRSNPAFLGQCKGLEYGVIYHFPVLSGGRGAVAQQAAGRFRGVLSDGV